MQNIGIIGCGNLGQAILDGIIAKDLTPAENIYISKRSTSSLKKYEDKGVKITTDNSFVIENADILIFALKPYTILTIIEELSNSLNPKKHTLVSVATGISISDIENVVGNEFSIFRAMPNTAAEVNESLTCICQNSVQNSQSSEVKSIFNSIGETIEIDENLMEAATVLGACGIAYVLRFIRSMVQGGIQIGFDAQTASKIVYQTVKGASELLIQKGNHPEEEIDKVTTPKGCTIAGLNEMEHNGFSSALIKGILTSKEAI